MTRNELFNVCQFFVSGDYEYVMQRVEVQAAINCAKAVTESVGARIGTTQRVIITDGGDNTVFDWEFGKGIVFPKMPPPAETYADAIARETGDRLASFDSAQPYDNLDEKP